MILSYLLLFSLSFSVPNTWTRIETTAPALQGHAFILLSETEIVMFGGFDGSSYNNNMTYMYTNGSVINTTTAAAVTARANHTFTKISDGYLVVGGQGATGKLNDVQFYNTSTNSWTRLGNVTYNTNCSSHSAAATPDGNLFVMFGGVAGNYNSQFPYFSIGQRSENYKLRGSYASYNYISPNADAPRIAYWKNTTTRFYFIVTGGTTTALGIRESLYIAMIDTSNATYPKVTLQPYYTRPVGVMSRSGHHMSIYKDIMYIFGGTQGLISIERHNLITHTWTSVDAFGTIQPPPLRYFASCATSDGLSIYIHGGADLRSLNRSAPPSAVFYRLELDPCARQSGCTGCLTASAGESSCGWCAGTHSCLALDNSTSQPRFEACPSTPMALGAVCPSACSANSCTSCAAVAGCGWCGSLSGYPNAYFGCIEGRESGPWVGQCGAWVYGSSNAMSRCETHGLGVKIIEPSVGATLAPGEYVFFEFEFTGQVMATVDVYAHFSTGTRTLLSGNLATRYSYFSAKISENFPQGEMTLEFEFTSPLDQQTKLTLSSEPFQLRVPNFAFTKPKEGDIYYAGQSIDVEWDRDSYDNTFMLGIYRADDLNTLAQWMGFFNKLDKTTVELQSYLPSYDNYVILAEHYATGVHLGKSAVFAYKSLFADLKLLTLNTTGLSFAAGDRVNITYTSAATVQSVAISLMERIVDPETGDVTNVAVLSIDQKAAPSGTLIWDALVTHASDSYFIRIEDETSGDRIQSELFSVAAPGLDVTLTFTHAGSVLVTEDQVSIKWVYSGRAEQFDLYLYPGAYSSLVPDEDILACDKIGTATAAQREFIWTVPDTIARDRPYTIVVRSRWIGLSGGTATFLITAPGQIASKSIAGLASVAGLAIAIGVGLFLFYWMYLRKLVTGMTEVK